MASSRVQSLLDLVNQYILSGGRRTTAANERIVFNAFANATVPEEFPIAPGQFDVNNKYEYMTNRRVAYILYRGWQLYNVYHHDNQDTPTKVIIELDEAPESNLIIAFY